MRLEQYNNTLSNAYSTYNWDSQDLISVTIKQLTANVKRTKQTKTIKKNKLSGQSGLVRLKRYKVAWQDLQTDIICQTVRSKSKQGRWMGTILIFEVFNEWWFNY